MRIKKPAEICIKCGNENKRHGQRWCHSCHAKYNVEWRKKKSAEIRKIKQRVRVLERKLARAERKIQIMETARQHE